MAVEPRLMTADELFMMPNDGMRHELVRGELRTVPPSGGEHGDLSHWISTTLGRTLPRRGQGRAYGAETGFILSKDPDTVRAPDAAYIRESRAKEIGSAPGYINGPPDMAFEIVSPHDRSAQVLEKVREWLSAGCLVVFVIEPRRRSVSEHRPGSPVRVHSGDATVVAPDVLQGWSLSLSELFAEP